MEGADTKHGGGTGGRHGAERDAAGSGERGVSLRGRQRGADVQRQREGGGRHSPGKTLCQCEESQPRRGDGHTEEYTLCLGTKWRSRRDR